MIVDSSIRSGNKVVDGYISQLEEEIKSFNANNSKKLIRSIDSMAAKISKDLDLLAKEENNSDGTEVELSNKLVTTYLKMVNSASDIKKFSEIADSFYQNTTIETTSRTEIVTEKKTVGNIFEEMQNKIKNG